MTAGFMSIWALAASAGMAMAGGAAPATDGGAEPLPRLERPRATSTLPAPDGAVAVAQASSPKRSRSAKKKAPPPREVQETEGLGLDLTEDTQQERPLPAEEQPAETQPVSEQPVSEQLPSAAPIAEEALPPASPRLRFGAALAQGTMLGLPNAFTGGALRLRGGLSVHPSLELGLTVGAGEWGQLGPLWSNRPRYAWLGTLETELLARAKFGAPFVEGGVGLRLFNVEPEARGYLVDTGPLMLSLGAGYAFTHTPLPLDGILRLAFLPGPWSFFALEAQAVVWVF